MAEMVTCLVAALPGWMVWWQIPLLLVLIALVVFWVMYRRRQM